MREFLNIQLIEILHKKIEEIDKELGEIKYNEKEVVLCERYRQLIQSKKRLTDFKKMNY